MSASEVLRVAISSVDLPGIIAQYFPDSRAVAGCAGRVRCLWRSNSRDLNGNLRRVVDGQWRVHDFVTGDDWDAFGFCVNALRMSRANAAKYLVRFTGLESPRVRSTSDWRSRKIPDVVALDDVPAWPEALESWRRVWAWFGQPLRLESNGVQREVLDQIAFWLVAAIVPIWRKLAAVADGVDLDLCLDALRGDQPRVSPCGYQWLSRIAMTQLGGHDSGTRTCNVAFACRHCGEIWSDLEQATCATAPRPVAHDPMAGYFAKLGRNRRGRR